MTNAQKELLDFIKDRPPILCADVTYDPDYGKNIRRIVMPSKDWLTTFLAQLDFEYDAGYGGQELYGTIWFQDGTWADRGEYDGSEWWQYNKCPEIPKEFGHAHPIGGDSP